MKTGKKVLILKLGYCETLANEEGFVPSLGDVFRHTVLLNHYSDYEVTWLTSRSAYPLLAGNGLIHDLITYEDHDAISRLRGKQFDEILCLEKAEPICNLAKSFKGEKHLGFGWNGKCVHAHPMAENALDVANGKSKAGYIQSVLYSIVGETWGGEDYILGYKPATEPVYDIGLNYLVGSKWPSKAWSESRWRDLEKECLEQGWMVSWQQGSKDLKKYMDWINSVRIIVTCDSLGMHLGLALKKRVVALFGPTPSDQIYMYGRGLILRGGINCERAPCMLPKCVKQRCCMDDISPANVIQAIHRLRGSGESGLGDVNECVVSCETCGV